MALIKCVECGNEVSDRAECCPKCGKKINTIIENKVCKECGQEIDIATGICTNCGYDPLKVEQKKKEQKKKVMLLIGSILVIALLVVIVCVFINANKRNGYIMEACEALADEEHGLPDIKEIYISEEVAEDSIIDYVYRVYIEYEGYWGTERVLLIVDDKGETYFATAYGDDMLANYLTIAEFEVNGIEGFIKPSDGWEELRSSEVRKFEKKFE